MIVDPLYLVTTAAVTEDDKKLGLGKSEQGVQIPHLHTSKTIFIYYISKFMSVNTLWKAYSCTIFLFTVTLEAAW